MKITQGRRATAKLVVVALLLLAVFCSTSSPLFAENFRQIQGAPILQLRADQEYLTAYECTTLRWDAANVDAVYILQKSVPLHGSGEVCPKQTTTYTVQAKWRGGMINQSVLLRVGPPKDFAPGRLPSGAVVLRDGEFVWDSGYTFEAFAVLLPTKTARVYSLEQIAVKWESTGDILHAIIYPSATVTCGGVQKYGAPWRPHVYWIDVFGAEGGDFAAPGILVTKDCSITVDATLSYLPITEAISDGIGNSLDPGARSALEQRTLRDLRRESAGMYIDRATMQLKLP